MDILLIPSFSSSPAPAWLLELSSWRCLIPTFLKILYVCMYYSFFSLLHPLGRVIPAGPLQEKFKNIFYVPVLEYY